MSDGVLASLLVRKYNEIIPNLKEARRIVCVARANLQLTAENNNVIWSKQLEEECMRLAQAEEDAYNATRQQMVRQRLQRLHKTRSQNNVAGAAAANEARRKKFGIDYNDDNNNKKSNDDDDKDNDNGSGGPYSRPPPISFIEIPAIEVSDDDDQSWSSSSTKSSDASSASSKSKSKSQSSGDSNEDLNDHDKNDLVDDNNNKKQRRVPTLSAASTAVVAMKTLSLIPPQKQQELQQLEEQQKTSTSLMTLANSAHAALKLYRQTRANKTGTATSNNTEFEEELPLESKVTSNNPFDHSKNDPILNVSGKKYESDDEDDDEEIFVLKNDLTTPSSNKEFVSKTTSSSLLLSATTTTTTPRNVSLSSSKLRRSSLDNAAITNLSKSRNSSKEKSSTTPATYNNSNTNEAEQPITTPSSGRTTKNLRKFKHTKDMLLSTTSVPNSIAQQSEHSAATATRNDERLLDTPSTFPRSSSMVDLNQQSKSRSSSKNDNHNQLDRSSDHQRLRRSPKRIINRASKGTTTTTTTDTSPPPPTAQASSKPPTKQRQARRSSMTDLSKNQSKDDSTSDDHNVIESSLLRNQDHLVPATPRTTSRASRRIGSPSPLPPPVTSLTRATTTPAVMTKQQQQQQSSKTKTGLNISNHLDYVSTSEVTSRKSRVSTTSKDKVSSSFEKVQLDPSLLSPARTHKSSKKIDKKILSNASSALRTGTPSTNRIQKRLKATPHSISVDDPKRIREVTTVPITDNETKTSANATEPNTFNNKIEETTGQATDMKHSVSNHSKTEASEEFDSFHSYSEDNDFDDDDDDFDADGNKDDHDDGDSDDYDDETPASFVAKGTFKTATANRNASNKTTLQVVNNITSMLDDVEQFEKSLHLSGHKSSVKSNNRKASYSTSGNDPKVIKEVPRFMKNMTKTSHDYIGTGSFSNAKNNLSSQPKGIIPFTVQTSYFAGDIEVSSVTSNDNNNGNSDTSSVDSGTGFTVLGVNNSQFGNHHRLSMMIPKQYSNKFATNGTSASVGDFVRNSIHSSTSSKGVDSTTGVKSARGAGLLGSHLEQNKSKKKVESDEVSTGSKFVMVPKSKVLENSGAVCKETASAALTSKVDIKNGSSSKCDPKPINFTNGKSPKEMDNMQEDNKKVKPIVKTTASTKIDDGQDPNPAVQRTSRKEKRRGSLDLKQQQKEKSLSTSEEEEAIPRKSKGRSARRHSLEPSDRKKKTTTKKDETALLTSGEETNDDAIAKIRSRRSKSIRHRSSSTKNIGEKETSPTPNVDDNQYDINVDDDIVAMKPNSPPRKKQQQQLSSSRQRSIKLKKEISAKEFTTTSRKPTTTTTISEMVADSDHTSNNQRRMRRHSVHTTSSSSSIDEEVKKNSRRAGAGGGIGIDGTTKDDDELRAKLWANATRMNRPDPDFV